MKNYYLLLWFKKIEHGLKQHQERHICFIKSPIMLVLHVTYIGLNMKVKLKTLSIVLSALALTACHSSVRLIDEINSKASTGDISLSAHTKDIRTQTKDLTLEQIPTVRRGAAYDEGSYKHMLSTADYKNTQSPMMSPNVVYDRAKYGTYKTEQQQALNRAIANGDVSVDKDGNIITKSKHKAFSAYDAPYNDVFRHMSNGSSNDYSFYELSRWERFCNGGKNMDKRDWAFVKAHKNAFPIELQRSCEAPSHRDLIKHRFFD